METWSIINALTFRSCLTPISIIDLSFLVHFFYLELKSIIDVLVPLFVVLCLG